MNRPSYIIPQEIENTMSRLENDLNGSGIWVRYYMFTNTHLVEMVLADANCYQAALKHVEENPVKGGPCIFGVERENLLLMDFTK